MLTRPLPDFDRPVYGLLGLPFDAVDIDAACVTIRNAVTENSRLVLVTPNTNFVILALRNPSFRESILRAGLSTVDGMVLVWIARFVGIPLPERATGADLFSALVDDDRIEPPIRVFMYGGPDGAADSARARTNVKAKGVEVVGAVSPGFGPIAELCGDETVQQINDEEPDFLVLALGAVKAHAWIDACSDRLKAPVISHLGAVVNFEAGTVKRAPTVFQRLGFEWLWRIGQEPALWRRYSSDGVRLAFLFTTRLLPHRLLFGRRYAKLRKNGTPAVQIEVEDGVGQVIRLNGPWSHDSSQGLRDAFRKTAMADLPVTIELEGTTYVDAAIIGLLMLMRGHMSERSQELSVRGASRVVRRILRHHCAEYLLDN